MGSSPELRGGLAKWQSPEDAGLSPNPRSANARFWGYPDQLDQDDGKRGVEFKGGSLHDGFGGFDLQNTGHFGGFGGFGGFGYHPLNSTPLFRHPG